MRRLLVALAGVAMLAGCGDDSLQEASAGDRRGMERAVDGWLQGLADGDGKAACRSLTGAAQDAVAKKGDAGSCEEVVERVSDLLVLESRQELEAARLSRALTRGDTGDVEIEGKAAYTGEGLLRSMKLQRSDGTWRLSGVGEAFVPDPLVGCRVGGMRAFEAGTVAPFWKREGRSDYRAYIAETCRRADERGLLAGEGKRSELQRVAGRVLVEMIRDGRIRDPRG